MSRPNSVIFTDHGYAKGFTGSISVDGVELQNVVSLTIEKEAGLPAVVEVVQRFYPLNLSANIKDAELNLQKEVIDDGQT